MRRRDLCQYMRTWSASQAWERSRGTDPVEIVRGDLARAWGDPDAERAVRWPLHGAIGRVGSLGEECHSARTPALQLRP